MCRRRRLRVDHVPRSLHSAMKNDAAVALGRLGGKSTSEAKAAASRANGKKGGWPKGKPRKKTAVDSQAETISV